MVLSDAYHEVRRISVSLANGAPATEGEVKFLREKVLKSADRDAILAAIMCFRQIEDPANSVFVEPNLEKRDIGFAKEAIWVLCWLGQATKFKTYILQSVDMGFVWDPRRDVGCSALRAAGWHLRTAKDRDFSQLLIRWRPRDDWNDRFYVSPPPGLHDFEVRHITGSAGFAMGYALDADPEKLLDDELLVASCVKRFIAERQDG